MLKKIKAEKSNSQIDNGIGFSQQQPDDDDEEPFRVPFVVVCQSTGSRKLEISYRKSCTQKRQKQIIMGMSKRDTWGSVNALSYRLRNCLRGSDLCDWFTLDLKWNYAHDSYLTSVLFCWRFRAKNSGKSKHSESIKWFCNLRRKITDGLKWRFQVRATYLLRNFALYGQLMLIEANATSDPIEKSSRKL